MSGQINCDCDFRGEIADLVDGHQIDAMRPSIDPRLTIVIELLSDLQPENQLLQLKNLCISNGGTWAVPENWKAFPNCLFEIQLFGISAGSANLIDLPHLWLNAANRQLDYHRGG